ncbi:MAG: DUF493 domain-containing protein [Candidatus Omnitrophota bacterium]
MNMQSRINKKTQIKYPCIWLYKVIGTNRNDIEKSIKNVIGDTKIKICFSNISNKGKYISFNLQVTVNNQKQRDDIYEKLKAESGIKIVF